MDWTEAFMGDDSLGFDEASKIVQSDNPYSMLLSAYSNWKNRGPSEDVEQTGSYMPNLQDEGTSSVEPYSATMYSQDNIWRRNR